MRKKGISVGFISGIILVIIAITLQSSDSEIKTEESEIVIEADVIMPIKVSRPGCEETNACFIPASVTVNTGDTVVWSNDDTAAHTVTGGTPTGGPDGSFDSGLVMAGSSFEIVADTSGSYDYFCMVHPWMIGDLRVN